MVKAKVSSDFTGTPSFMVKTSSVSSDSRHTLVCGVWHGFDITHQSGAKLLDHYASIYNNQLLLYLFFEPVRIASRLSPFRRFRKDENHSWWHTYCGPKRRYRHQNRKNSPHADILKTPFSRLFQKAPRLLFCGIRRKISPRGLSFSVRWYLDQSQ